MKKTLLLLWLLLSLILPACQPYMTYEEIEADAKITGDTTRLDKFEDRVVEMEAYYTNKARCFMSRQHLWSCDNFRDTRRNPKNLDEQMKLYIREHLHCGCTTPAAMQRKLERISR